MRPICYRRSVVSVSVCLLVPTVRPTKEGKLINAQFWVWTRVDRRHRVLVWGPEDPQGKGQLPNCDMRCAVKHLSDIQYNRTFMAVYGIISFGGCVSLRPVGSVYRSPDSLSGCQEKASVRSILAPLIFTEARLFFTRPVV